MKIPIRLLHPAAKLPFRARPGDAAYDLYACENAMVPSMGRERVDTGISFAIPEGFYGRIAERSGLAARGIKIGGGVLDSSYRGSVMVVLFNCSDSPLYLSPGDRIAQLIIERCYDAEWEEVDELPDSERGAAGFGSSGV